MSYKVLKEGKFEYVEVGTGTPLILLHGLFGALSNFKDVIEYFKHRFTVIIPIMPLYSMPIPKTNVKSLMKYIRDFINFKDFEQVHLLGNSLGGHVGLLYTHTHPKRVASLILTGSSGLYENPMGNTYPKKGDKTFVREKVQYTFYNPEHATDELVDECYNIVNDRGQALRVLSLARSAIRQNMGDELAAMKQPVCLIWGRNDTITPPEVAEEFHRRLTNSELYWIDECGHAPMMEHPALFNQILGNWFDKMLKPVQ